MTTRPYPFAENRIDGVCQPGLSGWCCNALIVQLHRNCDVPVPSVSIQASKNWFFWNSVSFYWSDNTCRDILTIFLRIFAPLGISWTNWRHEIVITRIVTHYKLISKMVFTAAGFLVLEDSLWLLPFPNSLFTPFLLPSWGEAVRLLSWNMESDRPFWSWVWYCNIKWKCSVWLLFARFIIGRNWCPDTLIPESEVEKQRTLKPDELNGNKDCLSSNTEIIF